MWKADPMAGRVLHFGIREHGMGAIMNGIAVHGGTRVFGGTFLTFSDYMRGAVRLAALMGLPVTYVWTHDSIGLGEDGPTHQPVEHLAALRAIPGLDVVRPADANETAACWQAVLEHTDRPAGLVLSRQNLPVFPRGEDERAIWGDTSNVHRGGYVLLDADGGAPDVVLVGTGSEVQLAVRGPRAPRGRRRTRPRRLDAVPRVVRRPGRVLPRHRDPADGEGPGVASRPASPRAGARSSATTGGSCRSTTTAPPPTTNASTASSASPPRPSPRRPTTASEWPAAEQSGHLTRRLPRRKQ